MIKSFHRNHFILFNLAVVYHCTAAGPEHCSPLEHIIVPPAEHEAVVIVSMATHQRYLNQMTQKIMNCAKKQKNIYVIVDCLTPLTDGGQVVVDCRKRGRFEGENAAERIEAIETMDNRVRNHPMYPRIWDEVLAKKPALQRNATEIHNMIMAEESDKERSTTNKAGKDPLFASKSSAAKIENRATYHQVYICQDAADMSGTVVHTRDIIDNGQPGGTCQNTHSVGKKLLDDTVLRVFIACAYKVEPCLKKKAEPS